MDTYDSSINFSHLSDAEFIDMINGNSAFLTSSINYLDTFVFEPITSQYDKHNSDLDVDSFLINARHVSLTPTSYIFLSDYKHPFNNLEQIFSVLCFNIRSFTSNFQNFIDQCLHEEHLDVMAFQETRLNSNITTLFQLPGYNLYTQCRNTEGGGVALYVSNSYLSSIVNNMCCTFNYLECVAVEVKCPNGLYLFISMYRPPKGEVQMFLTKLNYLLMSSSDKNYRGIYLLGDFNIDLLKAESNSIVRQFINIMYSFSYIPLITKPTRVTDDSATLIDNICNMY